MSYEVFKAHVVALINRAGGGIDVVFSTACDEGKHYANCSDGTTIIGSDRCNKVEVRWNGKNHRSLAVI